MGCWKKIETQEEADQARAFIGKMKSMEYVISPIIGDDVLLDSMCEVRDIVVSFIQEWEKGL